MRWVRRLMFVVALPVALGAIVLLLNFTAPNPTGRRYSSESIDPVRNNQSIAKTAEAILSNDLHLTENIAAGQLQCFCNDVTKPPLSTCSSCLISDPIFIIYRIPDFISKGFIAEVRNNSEQLYSTTTNYDQVSDNLNGAKLLKEPLWIYTRVNITLSPEINMLVAATGGGVVQYFTIPGYVDPVGQIAGMVLKGVLIVLVVCGLWEAGAQLLARARRRDLQKTGRRKLSAKPPSTQARP